MNRLVPRSRLRLAQRGIAWFMVSLLGVLHTSLAAAAQEETASGSDLDPPLPAWTWVENCHVQRGHQLTAFGTFASLLVTADTQTILSHPSAGKNRTGGSYLATIKQDLWSEAALITYVEGGTAYTLDRIIGDNLGTNGLARPAALFVSRVFLLQNLYGHLLQVAVGRIDLSDFFDTNHIANCEFTQFVSGSLVNNPTIPFPESGIGAAVRLAPVSWLHFQAAAADASAVATASDLHTAFRGRNNTFAILGLGLSPFAGQHAGGYRFLFWHNPASGWSGPGEPRDNHGFGVTFDQPATGNLTFFLRYGCADAPVDGLSDFFSIGALLEKPFPGREHDSVQGALALGNGTLHTETLVELGYYLRVNDNLALTPILQIIDDPAENPDAGTFVLAGLRAVYVF